MSRAAERDKGYAPTFLSEKSRQKNLNICVLLFRMKGQFGKYQSILCVIAPALRRSEKSRQKNLNTCVSLFRMKEKIGA